MRGPVEGLAVSPLKSGLSQLSLWVFCCIVCVFFKNVNVE